MLTIAICDDDRQSLDELCDLMQQYRAARLPELRFVPFSGAFALLSAIECGERFHIALMDVLMPNTNGIEAAREIRCRDEQMQIVFISSSREYAFDSYGVQASNYLLKPISREAFFAAMDKVLSSISLGPQNGFWVRDRDGGISRIVYSRLVYCEVIRKDVVFHLTDGNTVTCRMTLSELMQDLNKGAPFFQPHRSYLVNMDHVQRVTKTDVVLSGGAVIPLSRNKASLAMETFVNHSFQAMLCGGGGDHPCT